MPRTTTREHTAIADIVVQLTGSTEDEHRLAMATGIAETFGAHLVGVHLHVLPEILDISDPMRSGTIRDLLEASDREADAAYRSIEARMAKLNVPHDLRRLHGLAADTGRELAAITRTADLFIGTRPYGDPEGRYRIEEEVLFGTGRSCLFLPPGGTPHQSFDSIVVAWDPSRESARALAEAMPFLERARKVRVVHIASTFADTGEIDKDLARVVAHLGRHGIKAESARIAFVNNTGEQVEEYAHQQDADLLVMGAYGRARLVELVFGGSTRYVLRHATLPVLMAH